MNSILQEYSREFLRLGLSFLTDEAVMLFRRMYSNRNLELPIEVIIDNMNEKQLDTAMKQIVNTIEHKPKAIKEFSDDLMMFCRQHNVLCKHWPEGEKR